MFDHNYVSVTHYWKQTFGKTIALWWSTKRRFKSISMMKKLCWTEPHLKVVYFCPKSSYLKPKSPLSVYSQNVTLTGNRWNKKGHCNFYFETFVSQFSGWTPAFCLLFGRTGSSRSFPQSTTQPKPKSWKSRRMQVRNIWGLDIWTTESCVPETHFIL